MTTGWKHCSTSRKTPSTEVLPLNFSIVAHCWDSWNFRKSVFTTFQTFWNQYGQLFYRGKTSIKRRKERLSALIFCVFTKSWSISYLIWPNDSLDRMCSVTFNWIPAQDIRKPALNFFYIAIVLLVWPWTCSHIHSRPFLTLNMTLSCVTHRNIYPCSIKPETSSKMPN